MLSTDTGPETSGLVCVIVTMASATWSTWIGGISSRFARELKEDESPGSSACGCPEAEVGVREAMDRRNVEGKKPVSLNGLFLCIREEISSRTASGVVKGRR